MNEVTLHFETPSGKPATLSTRHNDLEIAVRQALNLLPPGAILNRIE